MTVGERLREARIAAGFEIKDVSAGSGIPIRFIEALEKGDYQTLGGNVYFKRHAARYAEYIGIFEKDFEESFIREGETYFLQREREGLRRSKIPAAIAGFNSKHYFLASGAAAGVLILGYFAFQISLLISAPDLVLIQPSGRYTATRENSIALNGNLRREARLTVNRRPIEVKPDGTFQESLYLARGLNRIEVEATNISGNTIRETRYVMRY